MPTHNQTVHDRNNNPSPGGLMILGAYLQIELHVPALIAEALAKAGTPIPAPIPGVALIDTGATVTCIEETALKTLQLNPIG